MFEIRTLLIAIPGLPLAAAILTAVLGPRVLRGRVHWLAVAAVAASFLCSILLWGTVRGEIQPDSVDAFEHVETLWTWAVVDDAMPADDGTNLNRALAVDITLRADTLTVMMLCMVTGISMLVVIYSIGYMHGDRSYWRFFTYMSLFVFSMTMLVLASNFLLLFVFWEAVGACSYLLIGFWFEKPEAAAAGKKAFLVNRVGDFGFVLALFLIWTTYGSLNYHDVADDNGQVTSYGVFGHARLTGEVEFVDGEIALAICLLLMLGACGKSAQFPLHVWLPDAMEGPTPVSALIHAATMVTAGVYMVARCTPLFMVSPDAQLAVAVIGGITALMAGIIALTQNDLKRILAYSTVSQLGYMFLALGCGTAAGIVAAMFHLFTHAFFKALLFLGAGSVMHGMGNVIDIRRFGGLRRIMPITCFTFGIGAYTLAGLPPFSGFFSKDAILGAVHDRMHEAEHALHSHDLQHEVYDLATAGGHDTPATESVYAALSPTKVQVHRRAYQWLYWIGLVTAFLTAFYTARAFFMTFFGPEVIPEEAGDHAHESPPVMWAPLAILSVFAIFVGATMSGAFSGFLVQAPSLAYDIAQRTTQPGEFHLDVAALSMVIAFAGVGGAAFLYLGDRREIGWLTYFFDFGWLRPAAQISWVKAIVEVPLLANVQKGAAAVGLGWLTAGVAYILLVVIGIILSPLLVGYYLSPYKLSQHKFYLDEIYDVLFVKPLRFVATASFAIDRWFVDGLVNLCGWIPLAIGGKLRRLQGGLVPFYGLAMILATMALVLAPTALAAARRLWEWIAA